MPRTRSLAWSELKIGIAGVEERMKGDRKEACQVFGPFDIAGHPEK